MDRPRRGWLWPLLGLAVLSRALPAPATESTKVDSSTAPHPKAALWRSVLLPGWGQFYNDRPFKAVLFSGLASGLLFASATEIDRLAAAQDPTEKEDRAARRNTLLLLFVTTATFAGLDAYVDAHLAGFKIEPIAMQKGIGISLSRRAPP